MPPEPLARTACACEPTRLGEVQEALCAIVAALDEDEHRVQFHPDFSPLGWHLGHATFVENFWIRETALDDDGATAAASELYLPQRVRKSERGARLPPKDALLDACRRAQRDNLALLDDPPPTLATHRLMRNGYLLKFLLQHHAMHLETMYMALTERCLRKSPRHAPQKRLEPAAVRLQPIAFAGGTFEIGGGDAWCFDNELPKHRETLHDFTLNATPASNAEYLGFIESGGYDNAEWWDAESREWLNATRVKAPHHWLRNEDGAWYGTDCNGCRDLAPDDPVYGLSRHEARAFARYVGARLPHESEWETAHKQDPTHERIRPNGRAWEWCGNAFRPYPGFKPFPYDEYSTPWFDNAHYSLRGYSRYTHEALRRPAFRNFYTADKRYVFAGVRVAGG